MFEVTFTQESVWDAAVYFIGLYSQLSNKQIALIEVQPNETETYKDTIINPPNTSINVKFKVLKPKFSDKMQLKYDLLETFILQQYVFDEDYKISRKLLLSTFIIEPKHEFPFLMNLLIIKYPQFNITKTTTDKSVVYKGITLTDQVTT